MKVTNPKIKNGYINIFQAFQLFHHKNPKKDINNYIKSIERLVKSNIIISVENAKKEVDFSKKFNDYLSERKRNFREKNMNYNNDLKKLKENPTVTFAPEYIEIEDNLDDELENSQIQYIEQLVAIYQAEEDYTGAHTKDDKNRFLLFPSKITLKNNVDIYMGVYLTIYKNGYAILHSTIEINDLEFEYFNVKGWDFPVNNVMIPHFLINNDQSYSLKKKSGITSINQLMDVYKDFITDVIQEDKSDISILNFYNLCLCDYAYQPEDFGKSVSKKFDETVYKLLYAPITEFTMKSTEEITSLMSSQFFGFSKKLRLYANSNRTISAYGNNIKKTDLFNDYSQNDLNRLLQNGSLGGVITAIETLLLKKMTLQQYAVFELNQNISLKRLIDLNIYEQTNYIHEFSQYFYHYGSVRELIKFLNKTCEDFLQSNLINERRDKLEKLIDLKKERNVASFTMIGPIISVAFTLILSLPTLEQFLKVIKKEHLLIESYVTINFIFIMIITWFLREQIKENYRAFKMEYLSKAFDIMLYIYTVIYLKIYDFAVFMNRDLKSFIR
jgi:hypothetical protein